MLLQMTLIGDLLLKSCMRLYCLDGLDVDYNGEALVKFLSCINTNLCVEFRASRPWSNVGAGKDRHTAMCCIAARLTQIKETP